MPHLAKDQVDQLVGRVEWVDQQEDLVDPVGQVLKVHQDQQDEDQVDTVKYHRRDHKQWTNIRITVHCHQKEQAIICR